MHHIIKCTTAKLFNTLTFKPLKTIENFTHKVFNFKPKIKKSFSINMDNKHTSDENLVPLSQNDITQVQPSILDLFEKEKIIGYSLIKGEIREFRVDVDGVPYDVLANLGDVKYTVDTEEEIYHVSIAGDIEPISPTT